MANGITEHDSTAKNQLDLSDIIAKKRMAKKLAIANSARHQDGETTMPAPTAEKNNTGHGQPEGDSGRPSRKAKSAANENRVWQADRTTRKRVAPMSDDMEATASAGKSKQRRTNNLKSTTDMLTGTRNDKLEVENSPEHNDKGSHYLETRAGKDGKHRTSKKQASGVVTKPPKLRANLNRDTSTSKKPQRSQVSIGARLELSDVEDSQPEEDQSDNQAVSEETEDESGTESEEEFLEALHRNPARLDKILAAEIPSMAKSSGHSKSNKKNHKSTSLKGEEVEEDQHVREPEGTCNLKQPVEAKKKESSKKAARRALELPTVVDEGTMENVDDHYKVTRIRGPNTGGKVNGHSKDSDKVSLDDAQFKFKLEDSEEDMEDHANLFEPQAGAGVARYKMGSKRLDLPVFTSREQRFDPSTELVFAKDKSVPLKAQTSAVQGVVQTAIDIFLKNITFDSAFPEFGEKRVMSMQALRDAAKERKEGAIRHRLKRDPDYAPLLAPLPEHRLSMFRGQFIKCAQPLVVAGYGLRKGCGKLVTDLLVNDRFIYPLTAAGNPILYHPFKHPAILDVIRTMVFTGGPKAWATRYPEAFISILDDPERDEPELPSGLVALASTVVYTVLVEWRNGKGPADPDKVTLNPDRCREPYARYQRMMTQICNEDRETGPLKYHTLMARLYAEIRNTVDTVATSDYLQSFALVDFEGMPTESEKVEGPEVVTTHD